MPDSRKPERIDPGQIDLRQIDLGLLFPAIEATRRSLRRLDDEHVPPKLRDVASRSGRLPTPLMRRLLAELDSSDWLRAEASEELGAGDDTASSLFLLRPEGWQQAFRDLIDRDASASEESRARRLEGDLKRALERASRLEVSLAQAKQRDQKAASILQERLEAESRKRDRALAAQQAVMERQRKETADLQAKAAELVLENAVMLERIETLRIAQRKRSEPVSIARPEPAWAPRDPVELAQHLDDIMAAARVPVVFSGAEADESARPDIHLPAAIRPDRAEAIQWLLDLSEPVTVAIDGWNAAHQMRSPPAAPERDRVIEAARRIAIASNARRAVMVVFDSSQGIEAFSTRELEVRFVPSADDELINLALARPAGLIVITSDRRVREAIESAGAVGLWSEALIDWLNSAGRRTFGT